MYTPIMGPQMEFEIFYLNHSFFQVRNVAHEPLCQSKFKHHWFLLHFNTATKKSLTIS